MHKENLRHDQEEKNEQINLDHLNETHKANLRNNQAIIKKYFKSFYRFGTKYFKNIIKKNM
jgi:hypothetical protein